MVARSGSGIKSEHGANREAWIQNVAFTGFIWVIICAFSIDFSSELRMIEQKAKNKRFLSRKLPQA